MIERVFGGAISCEETVDDCLMRIAADNPALNIFVHIDPDAARRAARESDVRRRDGSTRSPLDGVPFGVKANIAVAGMPYHGGIGRYADRIAGVDADCVARLRDAGAIPLGLLNMHEGAFGATTDNPWFGRTLNPLRRTCTAGGSSGGSGAAVAAGFVPLALGSDTVGSTRIPAAFTGTVGLKPAYPSISNRGLMPMASGLDVIGIHAATLSGCRAMCSLLGRKASFRQGAPRRLARPSFQSAPPLDDGIRAALDATAAIATERGIAVDEVELPIDLARPVATVGRICAGEMAALYPDLIEDGHGVSVELRERLAAAAALPHRQFVEARRLLSEVEQCLLDALVPFDAMLLPTTPGSAPQFGEPVGHIAAFTALANVSGLAAIALPWPAGGNALPASVQLMGHCEEDLFAVAELLSFS